jgi:hypothetical protein
MLPSHRLLLPAAALSCLWCLSPPALLAKHPLPGPHELGCEVSGDVVSLSWDYLGVGDDGVHAAYLERGCAVLARLAHDDTTFVDRAVPRGVHTYRVVIVGPDGSLEASRECTAAVGEVSALAPPRDLCCSIQEKAPPCVDLQWTNGAPYDQVAVRRDGAEIALLEGSVSRFVEPYPGPGTHRYEVSGRSGRLPGGTTTTTPSACVVDFGGEPPAPRFVRGDANDDGAVGLSDGIYTLNWLFRAGPELPCREAGDANASGRIDLADAVYTFRYLYLGGPEPQGPFPACEPAPALRVGCERSGCP